MKGEDNEQSGGGTEGSAEGNRPNQPRRQKSARPRDPAATRNAPKPNQHEPTATTKAPDPASPAVTGKAPKQNGKTKNYTRNARLCEPRAGI